MFIFFLLYKISIIISDLDMFISASLKGCWVLKTVDVFGDDVCMSVHEEALLLREK